MPRWISTTQETVWKDRSAELAMVEGGGNVWADKERPRQIIDGFGACFNELGYDAISMLSEEDQNAVYADFFATGDARGMGFTHCRMPVAANDFARDWYSYCDTPGDFAMETFSLARDDTSLVPYIRKARELQPDLHLWGSPWSPPVWMKTNGHYAQNIGKNNGLLPEQVVLEGADGFIQDDAYFKAYALYFRKYIEGYRDRGIPIEMVMPQNEWNSNQAFPSCVWSPEGLARFIPHLHREMDDLGIDIMLGTLERPDTSLFEDVYADPASRAAIKGVGYQWKGRSAAPFLARKYPDLKHYQTEQECGDGKNDWRFARYAWDMMRDYMEAGINVYEYWNMALVEGRASSWGWSQNSLITVDADTRTYRFTPDYYVLRHVAHFVHAGARRVHAQSWTGYENALAFVNPDGSEVIVYRNDSPRPLDIKVGLRGTTIAATLPPNSYNSISL